MKKSVWMGVIVFSLFAFTWGCGDDNGVTGDADTDLVDGVDVIETAETPVDVPVETPPDTPPDTVTDPDVPVDPYGCNSNDDCAESEFCEFMAGLCEGPGQCVSRGSGMCPEIYAPVCGCDDRTYGNDCDRMFAGVSLKHTGECGMEVCTMGDPGRVCDADEYCEGPFGICSEDIPGWCEPRPEACPEYYSPVCGCDGATYDNDCFRSMAGVWLAYEGECPSDICFMGDPAAVCDRAAEFCEGPAGVCDDSVPGWCEARPELCPDYYDPVCGCDGNTYSNDCMRRAAGVWLDYRGDCGSSDVCYQGDPTGACDRTTEFCEGPAGVCSDTVAGRCEPRPMGCPDVYDPVCGCDDVTYGNDCERRSAGVWLDYRGECGTEVCYQGDPTGVCGPTQFCDGPEGACFIFDVPGSCVEIPAACPDLWNPVCGCDGVTYENNCFRMAARVWLDYWGECTTPPPPDRCGPAFPPCPDPMYCEYPPGDCGRSSDSEGTCLERPSMCPLLWDPVCGCDGRTYSNDCTRRSAGVSLLHDGEC